ncbi:hypothetical protein [Sinomonas terrae]|uniref:Uncharacterized protein n=1 Tax=Sinomonas terrae TaxID=2908838 RepID=A0ABS9U4J6_9MICC|nr:hypothetical protein [Sinomonas terrae]MCH6471491.1 hypothetical protein [Sinomonas terrae]
MSRRVTDTAIDALDGRLTMPYATVAVTARRIGGQPADDGASPSMLGLVGAQEVLRRAEKEHSA